MVTDKVRVENLVKIFGGNPGQALRRFQQGATHEEILQESGNVVALGGVSFNVGEGEIFVVMGLSGCGKSTLVRCVNRLIEPTSGHIYVDDEDLAKASPERLRELRRAKMSMVFQQFGLFPHKTVAENVEYGLKIRGMGKERRGRALESLELVGLRDWASRYPDDLSGGMKQRVGLARALATDPDILLMDEAFSALDPLIRREMQDELLEMQRSLKKTIIFITHDLAEALKLGNHVAVMKAGGIVQIGTPQEILTAPADDYVAAFTQDVDRSRVFTVGAIMQPAKALPLARLSARQALRRIRELAASSIYVVEPHPQHRHCNGGVLGVLTERRLTQALERDDANPRQLLLSQFPQARPDAPIFEVYDRFTDGLPLAVVDEEGCLLGEVSQQDLFASLSADVPAPLPAGVSQGALANFASGCVKSPLP